MPAEITQERGREGVAMIKRWLEATTYIELQFDAYHHVIETTVPYVGGSKSLDLAGHYLTGRKSRIFVECKRYSSPGHQFAEFKRLVAIAYSAAKRVKLDYGQDDETTYLWVTTHPFALSEWAKLETREQILVGLAENPEICGDDPVNEEIVRSVASRVIVLPFNEKQVALSLSREELLKVRTVIDRKANSL